MFKTLILGGAVAALTATPVVVAATAETQNDKSKDIDSDNHTIFYDGSYFHSKEQLLRYYLDKHPGTISNKTVLGDVGHSIIDYDDGILNQNTLYDYDISKIDPVYYKSGGQTTPNYLDALSSYANRVFIRTKYQGVKNIFSDMKDAKEERNRLVSNLYSDYYNVQRPVLAGTMKINPLNEGDTNVFKDLFKNAITGDKKFVDSYSRVFDFPKTSLLDGIPGLEDLKTLENDNPSNYITLPTVESDFNVNATGDDEKQYIVQNPYYENEAVQNSQLNGMSLSFFGAGSLADGTMDFKSYTFKTDEVSNGTDSGHSELIPKIEADNNNKSFDYLKDKTNVNDIFMKGSIKQFANIKCNEGSWQMDLTKSVAWTNFVKRVYEQQEAISKKYGSNYNMTLSMSPKKEIIGLKKGSAFSPITCDYYDDPDTGSYGADRMSIKKLNLKYFDFKVKFDLKHVDGSLISDFSSWLSKSVESGYDTNHPHDSLFDLLNKHANEVKKSLNTNANEIAMDKQSETDIINNLLNNNLKNKLKNIPENILMTSKNKSSIKQKIFKINRGVNDVNLEYNHDQMYKKDKVPFEMLTKDQFINQLVGSIQGVKDISDSMMTKILNFIMNPYDGKLVTEDLVTALNVFKSKIFNIDLVPLDDTNSISNFGQIIKTHLASLNIYLNKNKSSLNTIGDYVNSTFIKRACFDLDKTFFLPNTFIDIKKGIYVLVNELMFNSGFSVETSTNIGPDNIFSGSSAVTNIKLHRDSVINADPPTVRVMYNVNGEAIIGDISKNQLPVYDSEELLVAEAQCQAKVRKSSDYIYYKVNGIEKQILNSQSNIYVLSIPGPNKRYFINYQKLKKYLMNWLMSNAMLIQ